MRNKFENFLLSLLLGTSILLGLSFWLNTKFGFNIFLKQHWIDLSKLQAKQQTINIDFYISMGVALFILIFGLFVINHPRHKKIKQQTTVQQTTTVIQTPSVPTSLPIQTENKKEEIPIPQIPVNMTRPPRLNLPKNMGEIVKKQHEQKALYTAQNKPYNNSQQPSIWDNTLNNIFETSGWTVKPTPKISGFTPNLFAIGYGEIVWIGGVDCDINSLKQAVSKLNTVFTDTLSDVPINIFAFILDTNNKYESDENILIFHNTDEIQKYLSDKQNKSDDPDEQENFNAYSDYIDTIIQYIKNL